MEFDLIYCCLGNGITVANRKVLQNNDYKTIAHISNFGAVTYYQKRLPQNVITEIEQRAKTIRTELTEQTTKEIMSYFEWWNYSNDKYNVETINKILFNGNKDEIKQLIHDFYNAKNGCWNTDHTLYNINKLIKEQ